MSVGPIEMNYGDTLRKAERLETISSELRYKANQMEQAADADTRDWQGDASEEFDRKAHQLAGIARSHADKLAMTAEALRRAAERYHRLEEMGNFIFGSH